MYIRKLVSLRVSTFLSTLSSHKVTVSHIPGKSNTISDYGSRHLIECHDEKCQICKFVGSEAASPVVNLVTVSDVLSGNSSMPFFNKVAWRSVQHDCADLWRAYAHLSQGTHSSRKARNLKYMRRYLNVVSIDNQGLIVVYKQDPGVPHRSLIVVPVNLLPGIITALHYRFKHASKHQNRNLWTIQSCSPSVPGQLFFAGVLCRKGQKICIVRDVHSTFTTDSIINDETAGSLRVALLINSSFLRSPQCSIRIDAATGFQSLCNDLSLQQHGIELDFGYIKNKNSNCVADKCIQEMEVELVKASPQGAPITNLQLQQVVDTLNSRISNINFSAMEIVLQRDQQTKECIDISDPLLSQQQVEYRSKNHQRSAKSKAPGG